MSKIILEKIDKLNYHSKESYKALRTNLQFCGSDVKTILFTSCTQNEGKSSVTFNVAVSMANAGKKIVFIDADLRKSVLIGRHKVSTSVLGLSHFLSGQCELKEIIHETNIDGMDMILCSKYPPNPAELLGQESFRIMIEALKKVYDYVIIDSPPLGMVIDSAIISTCCDGAVIVVEAGKTNYKFVQDIKKQLDKSKCKILGVVLNKVPTIRKGAYGKYGKYGKYGRYYGQYYGRYEDEKNDEIASAKEDDIIEQ